MKALDTLLASVVMCISSLPLILLILTLEKNPAMPANPPLDQAQVAEIQQLLIDHDPRQLLASPFQEVRLTESELNALATYLKSNNPVLDSIRLNAELVTNGTKVNLAIPVQAFGLVRYFNITLDFEHVEDRLFLEKVSAGALTLPSVLVAAVKEALVSTANENFQLVSAFFYSLHFQSINEERMVIMLDWQDEQLEKLGDQARQVFVSARESERLLYYQERLAAVVADLPPDTARVSLNDLMRPLFLLASINAGGGADPAGENRAVFIVLTTYLTDLDLSQLTGEGLDIPPARELDVRIDSREDLARHVVTSAAISASAGATMAQVLSVYTEVHDSRYRTGFSFTDLAANEAGALLGSLSTRSSADAIRFQERILVIADESAFLPELGTYDGMSEEQFIEEYSNLESEAYQLRLDEIHASILARPFFRDFN